MISVGKLNTLTVIKEVSFGVYLQGYEWGDILLPSKYVPKDTTINSQLTVFIYFDSNDKIIATTIHPYASLGNFALLNVIDVNRVGAFLDWGLDKDLLVPKPEQHRPMEKNKAYLVYVTQDEQGRIVASSKLHRYLSNSHPSLKLGEEVSIIVAETTLLGSRVIVNDCYWGLIHNSDIFQTLRCGTRLLAYVKKIRDDGKIDIVLQKIGHDNVRELAERVFIALQDANGFLPLHDKSPALDVKNAFHSSKKSFKSAIGQLYKQNKIIIEDNGIRLLKN
jgi:predicted RNA-binding protein (virulence factor B family)